MRRRLWLFLALSVAVCVTAPAGFAAEPAPKPFAEPAGGWPKSPATGAISKAAVEGANDPNAWFHLAVPKDYSPEKEWPLMVVLHGGPAGNGPDDVTTFFRAGLTAKGVISVYPNALRRELLAWNYPDEMVYVVKVVMQVARTYRVDPCRLYLVGVSMGGGGTWCQGAVCKDVWAALGPISGWYAPTPKPDVKLLAGLPIYIMHGDQDVSVPASRSRLAVKDLESIGRKVTVFESMPDAAAMQKAGDCIYREIKGADHNCLLPWAERGAPELGRMIAWLLARKRPRPADLDAASAQIAAWGRQFHWSPTGGPFGTYAKWK